MANYRPIALLDFNYKIFATVIAEHLRKTLPALIHPDQNYFLSKRNPQQSIHTMLNVLECYEKHLDKQVALIFLNAEKAFDNVSWTFIKTQLE